MMGIVEVFFYEGISRKSKYGRYGYVIKTGDKIKYWYILTEFNTENRREVYCFYRAIRRALKYGTRLRIYVNNRFIFENFTTSQIKKWINNDWKIFDGSREIHNCDLLKKTCTVLRKVPAPTAYLTFQRLSMNYNLNSQLAYLNKNARRSEINIGNGKVIMPRKKTKKK